MGARTRPSIEFKHFDFDRDISTLVIKENSSKNNCFIEDDKNYYKGFVLIKKPRVRTICNVTFFKSSESNKYLTRFEFKKENTSDQLTKTTKNNDVRIEIQDKEALDNFWKIINFLQGFKDLVDIEDFQSKYMSISFDGYLTDFKKKKVPVKVKELLLLAEHTELLESDIKTLAFGQRKKIIKGFYYLLQDIKIKEESPFEFYKKRHDIKENGEEAVWHHFLKSNDWIIGLSVKIVFIKDLLSEKKLGAENTDGRGSSKTDLLGLNYFTSLIELKTAKTRLFKEKKSPKSRANTFDFSNDFIEAYSQILAQREDIISNKRKELNLDDDIIDREIYRTIDPRCILILGNRNNEFPHIRSKEKNTKSDTFERFRNSIRNIDIITYDELFERAYHIVFSLKLERDWQSLENKTFIKKYLH